MRRPTMSSTTLDLEISLERNVCGACRFLPSLLPRWLYETIAVGLMPADTRKSICAAPRGARGERRARARAFSVCHPTRVRV